MKFTLPLVLAFLATTALASTPTEESGHQDYDVKKLFDNEYDHHKKDYDHQKKDYDHKKKDYEDDYEHKKPHHKKEDYEKVLQA